MTPSNPQSTDIMSSMAANKKEERSKRFYLILFIAYLILLFYFLFFAEAMGRMETEAEYRYNLTLFREIRRFYRYRELLGYKAFFINVFGNVLAFVPFGILMPKLVYRLKHCFLVTLMALELSLLVELAQLCFKIGSFDVDDLFLNTIGGFVGYLIYYFMDGRKKRNVSDSKT